MRKVSQEPAFGALDVRDVLDTLWLAGWLPSAQDTASAAIDMNLPLDFPMPEASDDERGRFAVEPRSTASSADSQVSMAAGGGAEASEVSPGGLYAPGDSTPFGVDSIRARPIRIPSGNALPNGLSIARALKAIPNRLASRVEVELDESATVDASAQGMGVVTVLRPRLERYFEATLVVDELTFAEMWSQTVIEIERMLICAGVFRDVRKFRLRCSPSLRLLTESGALPPGVLRDSTGRRVIFIFSPGVSTRWMDGTLGQLLESWGASIPVVLLHALPRRLWPNTALGEPLVFAANSKLGGPNTGLSRRRAWWVRPRATGHRSVILPMFSLEADSARRWAEMFAVRRGRTAPAFLVPTESMAKGASGQVCRTAPLKARFELFRAKAPEAFRLAVRLAAGPFTIGIAQLIQASLLGPAANHWQIAEIMLSGFVVRLTPVEAPLGADQVQFQFIPEVAALLLESLRLDDARRLSSMIQEYIEANFGTPRDQVVLMNDPRGIVSLPASARPFVELHEKLSNWLGFSASQFKFEDKPTVIEVKLAAMAGDQSALQPSAVSEPRDHSVALPQVQPMRYGTEQPVAGYVFISHSTHDDGVVGRLRSLLERLGYGTWTDSRHLAGGDPLESEIRRAIAQASHCVALLTVAGANSPWMRKEIQLALEHAAARPGYKVIPVLVPPLKPSSLELFFPEGQIPLAVPFDPDRQQNSDLLAVLRAALGGSLQDEPLAELKPMAVPFGELVVWLTRLALVQDESGGRRATAVARLQWAAPGREVVLSRQFFVRAPIGPMELAELAWYLETYAIWPGAQFENRAREVERNLPIWGERLFAVLDHAVARGVWEVFLRARTALERCVSIYVDPEPEVGSSPEEEVSCREAATNWLALPWELLHDGRGFLAEGARGCRVRRRLPSFNEKPPLITSTPIRVLVVSPRPEDQRAGYIDHRSRAGLLVEAFIDLGDRAEVELLAEATLPGLARTLHEALAAGRPFHAVHFDGHGIYDRHAGLGALLFEDPADQDKLAERRSQEVDAKELAATLRDHRVALVVLEACQSAKSKEDPMASVAGQLLAGGVASVVAMSHSVLVETAWRFVESFYGELSRGATVGKALLEGQRRLREEPGRGRGFHGELRMQDWFVPVLYQETLDPQLVRELPAKRTVEEIRLLLAEAVGSLKERPKHGFVGRSRELLALERLLWRERYAVLVGEGGEGKTTLAVELARWLVISQRFDKAAFVSVEDSLAQNARALLSRLGNQLVVQFDAECRGDFALGRQLVERALRQRPTLIVVDNVESMLGDLGSGLAEPEVLAAVLEMLAGCAQVGETRLLLTSRSPLPSPFSDNQVRLGRLGKREAIELVGKVLKKEEWRPAGEESQQEVEELVEAAGCHARSLELLAREVAKTGVRFAAEKMGELMRSMAARHPDDRERSLFASVELSLRRLPASTRARLAPLSVFQGGGHGYVIARVLGLDYDQNEEITLGNQLIEVGLAEQKEYGHLRLDPALGPALHRELGEPERAKAQAVWLAAMVELTAFLVQQRSLDAQLAATLTLLELPNLLATLRALAAAAEPERVVEVATHLELLLQNLGRPKSLAQVVQVREQAARKLGNWSHALFAAESAAIDRLLQAGRFQQAVEQAERLLRQATAQGQAAYPDAAFDLAMASFRLGRALKMAGAASAALAPLQEARERFGRVAAADIKASKGMASVCQAEIGDCLANLGRLDEAATAYEECIELAGNLADLRQVAVGKGQLATVRLQQRRYPEALAAWSEALDSFEKLGEPEAVATVWHQIGAVHHGAGQLEAAERAYQQSLATKVQLGNRPGEAMTLNQLGNLYSAMGRQEEAVRLYREAATVFAAVGDAKNEGVARSNVADLLVKSARFSEARQELERAIECKRPFGYAAEPWNTFRILHELEVAAGNGAAAAAARQQAEAAFLAYRLDGGENHTPAAQLVAAVGQGIAAGKEEELVAILDEIRGQAKFPQYLQELIPALKQILAGSRDPALATDPALDYDDAVELRLLLARLAQDGS